MYKTVRCSKSDLGCGLTVHLVGVESGQLKPPNLHLLIPFPPSFAFSCLDIREILSFYIGVRADAM